MINLHNLSFFDFDFIPKREISEQDFGYGSFPGIAEIIGHHLILFRRSDEAGVCALNIDLLNNHPEIAEMVEELLIALSFPLTLGANIETVENLLGVPDFVSELYADTSINIYHNSALGTLHEFGVHNARGLVKIELIHDLEIVEERISVYQR